MDDRPIAAYDIESIPDPDVGRRILGLEGSAAEVIHEMVRLRSEQTDGKSEYPQQPYNRVVCICVAWLDPVTGEFKLDAIGGEAMDERSHLDGFARLLRAEPRAPRLISWNGNGYDLPVIRYRALLHGIPMPQLYDRMDDDGGGRYLDRYGDLHVDVMDVLTNYGASYRVGLQTLSDLLGLPCKSFATKALYDHVLQGEEDIVREYCKLDVVDTLLVYLAWRHHQGQLPTARLLEHITAIRERIAADPHEGWAEIAAGLDSWPRWPIVSADEPGAA